MTSSGRCSESGIQSRVDQATNQLFGPLVSNRGLPIGQLYRPLVLLPRTMLREQARPAFPERIDLAHNSAADGDRGGSAFHLCDRLACGCDDARVFRIQEYPKLEDVSRMTRNTAVSEV